MGHYYAPSPSDANRLRERHATGGYTTAEPGRFFGLHSASMYRYLSDS
jgi:hypothetical protein